MSSMSGGFWGSGGAPHTVFLRVGASCSESRVLLGMVWGVTWAGLRVGRRLRAAAAVGRWGAVACRSSE